MLAARGPGEQGGGAEADEALGHGEAVQGPPHAHAEVPGVLASQSWSGFIPAGTQTVGEGDGGGVRAGGVEEGYGDGRVERAGASQRAARWMGGRGKQEGGDERLRWFGCGEEGALPAGDGAGAGGMEAGVRDGEWRLEGVGRWPVGEGGQVGVRGLGNGILVLVRAQDDDA